jgi:periplasmic protein TonB
MNAMKSREALAIVILFITAAAYAQQPEAPKPQRVRVASGVANSLLLHSVEPRYPEEARRQHLHGDVRLEILIDKEGKVASVKTLSGEPILVDAAIKAVKQWRYRPYLLNGDPVEVESTVTIKFHM